MEAEQDHGSLLGLLEGFRLAHLHKQARIHERGFTVSTIYLSIYLSIYLYIHICVYEYVSSIYT